MGRKKKVVVESYKDPKVYKKSKVPFHVNYTMRMFFILISFVFIGLLLSVFTNQIRSLYKDSRFNINENGYITYDVELIENDYYDENKLGMDMAYIPNLINKINLKFNYTINSEDYLELSYENSVKFDFVVLNNTDNSVLYHINLYEINRHVLDGEKLFQYCDLVEVDYVKYKKKYDELVLLYGKDITGYINISNTVNKISELDMLKDSIKEDNVYSVKIPITNDIFSINLGDETKFRRETLIIKDDIVKNVNRLIVVTIVVLSALCILVTIVFIRLLSLTMPKQSKYDKFVNKILKEYDSVIVETLIYPKEEGLNKISVNSFKEILDTHDLLHKPILYYNVVRHMKCIFYVLDNKDLYVYTVKEVDLEK